MTPVLRTIIKSLNSTVDALASIDNISDKAFQGVKRDVQAAAQAVDALEKEMVQLEKPIQQTRSGFSGWQSAIVTANQGLQLIQATMAGINKVATFADRQNMLSSRLKMMVGDAEAALALEKEIMASANRSRASYVATADSIAQMGMMASEAFSQDGKLNTKELVAFTESINKQLVMSGVAGTAGADAALYQLTQAMSSGTLRGDELRSIMEQAPVIADTVSKYMGVSKGEMREMAAEGLVTSEIVKNAMLSALDETNEKFKEMPLTFGQAMTLLQNKAIQESKPLTEQFSKFITSDAFQSAFSWVMNMLPQIVAYAQRLIDKIATLENSVGFKTLANDLNVVVGVLGGALELAVTFGTFIIDNWSLISPIVWGIVAAFLMYRAALIGVAIAEGVKNAVQFIGEIQAYRSATAALAHSAGLTAQEIATHKATIAQTGLNAALLASPVTWIILAVIALIAILFVVVNAINKVKGTSISALGIIVGAVYTAGAGIWNFFLMLVDFILAAVNNIWNHIISFVNFFGNVFRDPIGSIIHLFADLATSVLTSIQNIAKGIDNLLGTDLASGVGGWIDKVQREADKMAAKFGNGKYEVIAEQSSLTAESLGLKRWDYKDAYSKGYGTGSKAETSITEFLGKFNPESFTSDIEKMAGGMGTLAGLGSGEDGGLAIQGEVSIADEDIKLLKDVAAAEWVNKYTTLQPQMTVTFGDVHETADAEKLLDTLETMMEEAYASALVGG